MDYKFVFDAMKSSTVKIFKYYLNFNFVGNASRDIVPKWINNSIESLKTFERLRTLFDEPSYFNDRNVVWTNIYWIDELTIKNKKVLDKFSFEYWMENLKCLEGKFQSKHLVSLFTERWIPIKLFDPNISIVPKSGTITLTGLTHEIIMLKIYLTLLIAKKMMSHEEAKKKYSDWFLYVLDPLFRNGESYVDYNFGLAIELKKQLVSFKKYGTIERIDQISFKFDSKHSRGIFIRSIIYGDFELFFGCLSNKIVDPSFQNNLPFLTACKYGRIKFLKILVEKCFIDIKQQLRIGRRFASENGFKKIFDYLN
jgi:hypothetical protein